MSYRHTYRLGCCHSVINRSNILRGLIMFEVQTYTLFDGYVNTWLDNQDKPIRYRSRRQAMRDLRDYIADCQAAVDDGFLDDFNNDLIIVRV